MNSEMLEKIALVEISKKYCEGDGEIEDLIDTFNYAFPRPKSNNYQMLVSYISTKLSCLSNLFLMRKLQEKNDDLFELISLGRDILDEAEEIVKGMN